MTSKATPRDDTTTTTTTRFLNMPRALTVLLLLATVLPPPSSSSPLSLPSSSSSSALSSSSLAKRAPPAETDCNNDLEVSAICFNCAALTPKDFHTIHTRCCLRDGPVRDLCVGWYTEEPKKGRRLKYF